MPKPTNVLIDHEVGAAYYLAFDLLLARAPIEDGQIATQRSTVAYPSTDPPESPARLATIRLALLEDGFNDDAWRATIEEARADAAREADRAGLAAPPSLGTAEIVEADLDQ
jgi:hypothetical protein